jgi:hypothetical protein
MSGPFISILTPTGVTSYGHDRSTFLPLIYDCIRNQTFEWLVLDVKPDPSPIPDWVGADTRIRYEQVSKPMSIGERRNKLCGAATGDYIAMFDDDDYYAPTTLSKWFRCSGARI